MEYNFNAKKIAQDHETKLIKNVLDSFILWILWLVVSRMEMIS